MTTALRRTHRTIAMALLWLGLCIGTLSVFASHPVFALGVWQDSEPMGLTFYAAAAACFAGLALLCLDGTAVLRALGHPAVLAPAALGAWSLATAPFVPFPMLSVFGPAQNSLGALWCLAFAAFVASAIVLRANRRLFASLVAIAATTALVAAGFNLWRVDWPNSVRDMLLWLPRETLLEFNEYQAYYPPALMALALVMARERRRTASRLLAVVGVVSLLVSRNRSGMVAGVVAFLPMVVPAAWSSRLARLQPWRDRAAIAAIAVIGLGSYLALRLLDLRALAPTLWSRRLIFEGIEPSLRDGLGIGHGWGRYADFQVANLPLSGLRLYNPDWAGLGRDLFHSHHVFLEALFAAGLPGLVLAAAIPGAIILGAQRRRRGIAIAFVLSWLVVDCFWFMMPATVPVLALACGALAESSRSLAWRWTRGPWAIAWLALLLVTTAGIVELGSEARTMSRLIACLHPDGGAACAGADVAVDPRGAEHGLASIVGDTVPTLVRSGRPLSDGQIEAVRRVLAEAERRAMAQRATDQLTLELADAYAAIAFSDGGERVLPPALLFSSWTRVMHDVLRWTPQRLDALVPYLSWLLVRGQHTDIEAMLVAARRVDADHPVVLWFSGIEALQPGDAAKREQALGQMRRAIDRGLERFMPVDASIKARLAEGARK
jgi:hypothetical protein